MSEIFEQAVRQKLRFQCQRGVLNAEDLFDLPLGQLDEIFKGLNTQAKQANQESLLATVSSESKEIDLKLEVVKRVFAVKQEEQSRHESEAANRARKEKLLAILAQKQDAALLDMTPEQLTAMIESM